MKNTVATRTLGTLLTLILTAITFALTPALADANSSFPEIIQETLDETTIELIREEIDLPNDYDVNRAVKGMDYLVSVEEFTIEGAAGLIGNGYAESRLLLNAEGGYYIGLFQWDPKHRWPKVKKYLEDNEVDISDQELLYMWEFSAAINSEDAENYQHVIEYCKNATDAQDSAEQWCRKFEGTKSALNQRKRVARLTAAMYKFYLSL